MRRCLDVDLKELTSICTSSDTGDKHSGLEQNDKSYHLPLGIAQTGFSLIITLQQKTAGREDLPRTDLQEQSRRSALLTMKITSLLQLHGPKN